MAVGSLMTLVGPTRQTLEWVFIGLFRVGCVFVSRAAW